jgi:hypothetical protein
LSIPSQIANELQQSGTDVRAEVILNQLLERNIAWEDFVVHTNKFFYRNFSKDIFNAETDNSNDFKEILHINLSRSGLYDLLPEGLFFQPVSTSRKPKSASEMAEEYKINKKQELEIRKFFSPLENEFFYHRVKNFTAEKTLLNGLNDEELNRYFIKFWRLAKDITPVMALRITLLLPYIHQIAGDPELMASCLQNILGEKVTCSIKNENSQAPAMNFNVLGKNSLGNELVCGNSYLEDEIYFVFVIEDLKKSVAQDYLPGGKLYKTLQTFYRFFVPVNAEIKTEIKLNTIKQQMHIGNMEEATLGIATVI